MQVYADSKKPLWLAGVFTKSEIDTIDSLVINTRRYSPLRGLTSSSCGVLRLKLFLPTAFYAVSAYFRPLLVFHSNLCRLSRNVSNFENNPKNLKNSKKSKRIF